MITNIRHRGLKKLFEKGQTQHLQPNHISKIRRILGLLDVANSQKSLNLPGFRIHSLKGNLEGFWSITVTGNWRIIFRFEDGNVCDVDLLDYH